MSEHKKRDRDINSSTEEEKDIFKKSRRIIRTPELQKQEEQKKHREQRRTTKEEEKEELAKMEELKELRKMMREVIQELRNNTQEIKELKEEIQKKEERWASEKVELVNRIKKLEDREEKREKEQRKNNIIIKGMGLTENENEQSIKDLIKKSIGVDTVIKRVYNINKKEEWKIILAEVETWEQKREIMLHKNKLKGTKIYIENDLTKEERRIQTELVKIAKDEREKGSRVKIGYKKLVINNVSYEWNEMERGVTETDRKPKN